MKQLYYVIRTLLRGRGSNIIKVISLGLGLTMSILLFHVWLLNKAMILATRTMMIFIRYTPYSRLKVNNLNRKTKLWSCGRCHSGEFPKEVESATSIAYFVSSPLYNGSVRIDARKILADSLFFKTMGIEVLSGNPEKI